MKEKIVRDFLMNFEFTKDWKVNDIKEGLRNLIGETPGIQLEHKKDLIINEVLGTAEEIRKVDKVKLVFTETDDTFKVVEVGLSI